MMKICHSQSVPRPNAAQGYCQSQQLRQSLCVNVYGQSCLSKWVFQRLHVQTFALLCARTIYMCTSTNNSIQHQMHPRVFTCVKAPICALLLLPPNVCPEIINVPEFVCVCVAPFVCVRVLWCPAPVDEIIWQSMEWQSDLLICVLLARRESLSYSAAISPGHCR